MAEKKQTGGTGKRAKSEKPAVLSGTVPEWSSTTVISQLLGKTVRRVQQLTQEGVLETEIPPGGGARKYRTCATVQRYVAYVEAKAQETGENSRAAELTLKKLEAEVELKESQGQLHRLKTAIAEGRYLAADHATEELTEFMASFKKIYPRAWPEPCPAMLTQWRSVPWKRPCGKSWKACWPRSLTARSWRSGRTRRHEEIQAGTLYRAAVDL